MMNTSDGCTRRHVLRSLAGGSLLLPGFLSRLMAEGDARDPLAARAPHFPARAKHVIFLFSQGGVSQLDTFDYKPRLIRDDGKEHLVPGGGLSREKKKLLRPVFPFRPGGRSWTMVSDIFPRIRERMDDICLINSMKSD